MDATVKELLDFIFEFHEHCDGEGLQHGSSCWANPPDWCDVVALGVKHGIARCTRCGRPEVIHAPEWRDKHEFAPPALDTLDPAGVAFPSTT